MRRLVLYSLTVSLLLSVCMTIPSIAAEKPTVIKWASIEAVGGNEYRAMQWVVQEVERRSQGRLKIDFYPASQLGSTQSLLDAVVTGSVDVFIVGCNIMGRMGKDWIVDELIYVFRDLEHRKKYNDGPLNKEREDLLLKEHGVRVIAHNWYRTPHVVLARKPIFKPDDFKGLKMRVPESKGQYLSWQALGAKPTTVTWGETYLALRQGVVDAVEASFQLIRDMKFHEAAKYITITNSEWSYEVALMNERKFQSLSKELQDILVEVTKAGGELYEKLCFEQYNSDLALLLKEGAYVIYVDITPFKDVLKNLPGELERQGLISVGLWDKIQAIK